MLSVVIDIGAEVRDAQSDGRPIVAMESTIFSNLGLPSPDNAEALRRCEAKVREGGGVPAVTAVIDGRPKVGLTEDGVERVLTATSKVAERDLPVAVAQRWPVGVTTVSASVALAAKVGIEVFATGGIGGVHRGSELTGDVSADLGAIARHPVVVVSAGAKAFLDLPKTLEVLETLSVPVLGWRTERFPAFYVRDSGAPVAHRVDDAEQVAGVHRARVELGGGGLLLAVPIPAAAELDPRRLDEALEAGLAEVEATGLRGPEVTPVVLAAIGSATGGDSVPANLALAEHNARVAVLVARALTDSSTG
ncbi:MAG: pseudouridine-5'-phosphate glycosidase [Actinomycetota bacterium]|nr:pseudouridine-5'-phosphate glycosidase [Actinomycetota bacterium]